jgi:AcrR family transcriptional regulator
VGGVSAKPAKSESARRIGAEDSKTRAQLVEAAQQLLIEGGYAAVSSRRVAAKAGLKPQLVHYYFRTMDDLFLAVFQHSAEQNLERQARALASPQPLRALWEFSTEPSASGAAAMEFMALANHRPAIRDVIAEYAEQFRRRQAEALTDVFASYHIDPQELPPMALLVLMASISNVIGLERGLGVTTGHAELLTLVEGVLDRYEPREAS